MSLTMQENLAPQLEALLLDLHNDFFSDPKSLIHKLETLLFDVPLNNSPDLLSKLSSLLLFDPKTNLFKYLLQRLSDKDRIASNFRKNLLDVLKKYLKTYPRAISSQAMGLIKNYSLQLFQTDISSPVKEAALGPIISLVKMYPKDTIRPILQVEKLLDILLKNLRDIKHTGGVKSRIWQLSGLLCNAFPRDLDAYKVEVSEICFTELSSQVQTKNKPEIVVIEGLLKALHSLLYENYLTNNQLIQLYNILKVLITPIADVHNYRVIRNGLKVMSAHCSLFAAQILKDSISLINLITGLFKLSNRPVREYAGELLESVIKLLVSILDPTNESHKPLFKEILEKILSLLDNPDLILICSGIRGIGHFSRSVRLFRSETKVRDLFSQMLDFSALKVIRPLESLSDPKLTDPEKDPLDSFKTILFLQKQVYSFLNAYASLIQNLSLLSEPEAQGLYSLCILALKLHRKFLSSYKPMLYDAIITLFLNIYVHHHGLFIPWMKRVLRQGMFETLKIPENVILAGEDYHNSLREACEIWESLFARDLIWTQASKSLFLSCFFQEILEILEELDLSYSVRKSEETGVCEVSYIPNNQDHQQYLYRLVLFLDEILRKLIYNKEIEGILMVWIPGFARLSVSRLRKLPRTLALYKLLRLCNEILEETRYFDQTMNNNNNMINKDTLELKTLILSFFIDTASLVKEFQEELLIDSLKALISVPISLILQEERLKALLIPNLKQAFSLGGPLALSLMALGLDVLEKMLSKGLFNNKQNSLLTDQTRFIIKEVLPFLCQSLYLETLSLRTLDKKLLFTLTLREINIELEAFQEKTLDFLGKIAGLAHNMIKNQDFAEEDPLILWDFEAFVNFPMPLTSKKLELNLLGFLPRLSNLLKEAPSLQIQTTACELLHSVLVYMIGKSANNPGNKRNSSLKKKSFAAIYARLFPVIFSLAAGNSHPCSKLLHALSFQIIRWLANSRESESADLSTLINSLMEGLSNKEDSSLREFCYQGLYELLKWTVKQRTHQELEQDLGIFKGVVKRLASFGGNPDPSKRLAALLGIKALVITYKEDTILPKKFAKETFSLCLRVAGTINEGSTTIDRPDRGGDSSNEMKTLLSFVVEKHLAILGKLGQLKAGTDEIFIEIYEGVFKPDALLRENCLRVWEDLMKNKPINEDNLRLNELIISPIGFRNIESRILLRNYEYFQGQLEFWRSVSRPSYIGLKILEMKDFIRTCHNIRGFLENFAKIESFDSNDNMNEKLEMKKLLGFKSLLSFFLGVDGGIFTGLFKKAFEAKALLDCFISVFIKKGQNVIRFEALLEETLELSQKIIKKFHDNGLIFSNNLVEKVLEAIDLTNGKALCEAIFTGQVGQKRSIFWLKFLRISLNEAPNPGFFNDFLKFLRDLMEEDSNLLDTQTTGLRIIVDFLFEFKEIEDLRTFILEAFIRQNAIFQRFEGDFLRYLACDLQLFRKSLELMKDSLELYRFLLPILQLTPMALQNNYFIGSLQSLDIQLDIMKNQERLLLTLKLCSFLLTKDGIGVVLQGLDVFMEQVLPSYIMVSLKYPQNPMPIIIEGSNLLGSILRVLPRFLEKNQDIETRISSLLAGILSLSAELEGIDPKDLPEQKLSQIKDLGNALLGLIKESNNFTLLRRSIFQMMRMKALKKHAKEAFYSMISLKFFNKTKAEILAFLEDLLKDLFELETSSLHIHIIEALCFILHSPDLPQENLLEFASISSQKILNILKDPSTLILRLKSYCFQLFDAFYEALTLENIRENLHKRLYGTETSKNELTKNLIEICHQSKKTRFSSFVPLFGNAPVNQISRAEYLDFTQTAYNCLISIVRKTQNKENIFNQFLFAVSRDKNEELWANLIDTETSLAFEVRTNFKDIDSSEKILAIKARQKAESQEARNKNNRILHQSFFSQSQIIPESSFLPEILHENADLSMISNLENKDIIDNKDKTPLEMDLINSHKNMRSLISVIDMLNEKFPANPPQQPLWMQSLYLEASRKELEPQILCFLVKIVMNRSNIFKPFAKYWHAILIAVLVNVLFERKSLGKGFHYFLRDICLLINDWQKDLALNDLFQGNTLGNIQKELLCKAGNGLMKVLADENKEIFRSNIEIFERLIEKWAPYIYLERSTVQNMLAFNEEAANSKNPKFGYLFKYLGVSLLELGLAFKIPMLKDFQEFLTLGGIGGNLSPQAFSLYYEAVLLRDLLKNLSHKKKLVAFASISAISRLFKDFYVQESQETLSKKREVLIKTVLDIYSSDRARFAGLLREVIGNYPDFLRNREVFGHTLDLLTIGQKREKGDILRTLRIYIQSHNDRTLIETDLKDICMSIQGSLEKILMDLELETHRELINTLKLFAGLLHLDPVMSLFINCYQRMASNYLRRSGEKSQEKIEGFIDVSMRLMDSMASLMGSGVLAKYFEKDMPNRLLIQIKRALLRSLSIDDQALKARIFSYFEKEQSLSQAPTQRLFLLITELYDPEIEDLWLTSAMPLLLSLAKESSDYERLLFDEPLTESLKFYDFDFRNPDYLRQINRTQPLTPVFSLSLSQNVIQPSMMPSNEQDPSMQNQMGFIGGVRPTQNEPMTYKDPIVASQLFNIRKTQAEVGSITGFSQNTAQAMLFPGSTASFTNKTGLFNNSSNNNNSINNNGSKTTISNFLKPNPRKNPGKTQKMSFFLAENMVDFSQSAFQNNRLRFQAEKTMGNRITKPEMLRARQAKLFEMRLAEARKHEIQALRKYRIGELPDIEIKTKDILDPLQGLCFGDQEIAAEIFVSVFTGLYKEENSEDLKKGLLEGLMGFLRGSRSFNKRLIAAVHKILYQLCRQNRVLVGLDAKDIKESGIKAGSLYTSGLLLEELLIMNIEGGEIGSIDRGVEKKAKLDKGIGFRENSTYWLSLLEIYRDLMENESIEGVMTNILSREYNEDELRYALDHKLRGNYRLALRYFEQKLVNPASLFEEEQNNEIKAQIIEFLKIEKTQCYALLGKWDSLKDSLEKDESTIAIKDKPIDLNKSSLIIRNMDLWLYSQISENQFQDTYDKIQKCIENQSNFRLILEENYGYELSVLSLFQNKPDLENSKHWLSQEKKAFMRRFRQLGSFANQARHDLIDKLQRVYEIKEFQYLLKQETEGGFHKALGNLLVRWSGRAFSIENTSILAWYKTFLIRDICLGRVLGKELGSLEAKEEKRITELVVENQVKIAGFLIKLGFLDSGDTFLVKVLAKRPKDYFSWDLIKTIARLKIEQANRTVSKEITQIAGNFQQIASVLEKQRDKFKSQIDDFTNEKFRVYIRKCHEGLLDLMMMNYSEGCIEKDSELTGTVINALKQIYYEGYAKMYEPNEPHEDIEDDDKLKRLRLIRKETENLSIFCEKIIRLLSQNPELESGFQKAGLKDLIYDSISQIFLKSVLKGLSLGLRNDKLLLKMVVLVEKTPDLLGPIFRTAFNEGKIPGWLFLKWLPQIMHFLTNSKVYKWFEPVFKALAQEYPQAFIYPFNINHQRMLISGFISNNENNAGLNELKELLINGFPCYKSFIMGLNLLTHPEHRLTYHQTRLLSLMKTMEEEGISQIYLKELQQLCVDLYFDVFCDDKDAMLGKYNEKFARNYKKAFLDLCGGLLFTEPLKLTTVPLVTEFKGKLLKIFKTNNSPDTLRKIPSGLEKLESFSRYLFLYSGEDFIEIPGQYSGSQEPTPQYNIKVLGFDQALLTLDSLRRPKRIIMYGSDEKTYKFLVKGVEDLRLDQRIEQIFQVMNEAFILDFEARNRDLRLKTFGVIPMSRSLGLLEWLENTSTLKDLLEKELKSFEGELVDLKSQNKAFAIRMAWISGFNSKATAQENSKRLLYLDQKTIEEAFIEHEALIPRFLWRNALEKLSVSHEAFFLLKNKVLRNIAAVSIACYILGIGDRHLENFLINWKTGEIIAIDFGYSFGAGVRLSLPELLPFRMTRCFEALTLPVGISGILRKSLILLLKSLRKASEYLLEIAETFIKDPLLDFSQINKEKTTSRSGNSDGVVTDELEADNPTNLEAKKLEIMRKKLKGVSSWKIMLEELEFSRHAKEGYKSMIWEAVKGAKNKLRGQFDSEIGLEVQDQVDCLIDHAKDKNLLGRTWIGWTPYV